MAISPRLRSRWTPGSGSGFPAGSGSIARHAESAGILAEVRGMVDDELTVHQRRVFVAIVVDGIPLDALAAELGLRRNAIYKVIFDARRKIRRALVANGYLEEPGLEQR